MACIDLSWPPGMWRLISPSPVVSSLSDPQQDYRSCVCCFHTHNFSSVYDGWSHQCYYFWGRSSLRPSWDAMSPCQGWLLAYMGQGRFPVYRSWWMIHSYHCRLPQDTAPYPSSSCQTFPRLSLQYQRYNPLGHCTNPWSLSQIQVPELGFWSTSY